MKKFLVIFLFAFQFSCSISDPEMMQLLREINTQNQELLEEVKSLKTLSDSLINEIKGNSAKQEDLLKVVSALQTDITKIIQEISKLNVDLKKQGVDIDLLKSQIADLQKKYEQIIVKLEDLQKLSKILGEIENIKIQLIDLNKKYETAITTVNQNKDQLEQLKSKIESVQKQLDENLSKISELSAQLGESDANVEDILDQITALQIKVNQLLLDFQELLGVMPEPQGTVTSLDCISIVNAGNLVIGQAASNVNTIINYQGGNGKSHSGQTVNSTGVTGLTATLSPGTFATGNGTLTYVITGTPATSGVAKFALNIGGKICEISRSAASANSNISALNCNSAVNTGATGQGLNKLVNGYSIPGAKSTITYAGGDGSNHTGQIVNSTGVTGLTATLLPGKFNFGSGNLSYSVSGTPTSSGTASFELSIGGQTCVLSWDVNDNHASRYPNGTVFCEFPTEVVEVVNPKTGRIWMDRNLGAIRSANANNDINSYGDLYQWGRRADGHQCRNSFVLDSTPFETDQPASSDFIVPYYDWRSIQNDNLWQGLEGVNNPCPIGFRLPTDAEWIVERESWETPNGAFLSKSKLPFGGSRSNVRPEGSFLNVGLAGNYWSSTTGSEVGVRNFNAIMIHFGNKVSHSYFDGQMRFENRGAGLSVRCIKN